MKIPAASRTRWLGVLLLAGFLAGKTHLEMADVNEVVREFAREGGPQTVAKAVGGAALEAVGNHRGAGDADVPLDIDPSKLQLDTSQADEMLRQLAQLSDSQKGDRMLRLERSLLRLERVNLQTLAMLQQLVAALKKTPSSQEEPR